MAEKNNQPMLVAIQTMIQAHAEAATLGEPEGRERCDVLFDGLVGTVESNDSDTIAHLFQHMIGVTLCLIWYDAEGNETADTVDKVMKRLEIASDQMILDAARVEFGDG